MQSATADTLDVVLVDGDVAGYMHIEREPDMVRLTNIWLAPAQQGPSIGTAPVHAVIAAPAPLPVELGVRCVNPARALYERLGFGIIAETTTHFHMRRDPDSASARTIAP